jgi:hypothetical protein
MASMSGSILGDEFIESYFLCKKWWVYTVEIYQDRFSGEEKVSVQGPCPKPKVMPKSNLSGNAPSPGTRSAAALRTKPIWGDRLIDGGPD